MLRKGHRRRAVLVYFLIVSALILAVAAVGVALPGATSAGWSGPGGGRPVITTALPPLPAAVRAQQAAPDANLTFNTPDSDQVDPTAWVSGTTNRIGFASNGVDADGNGRIDPTLPANAHYTLWIMRPDGTEQIQIADLPGDSREPSYDPSRNMFAFANDQSGTYQIYIFEIATSTVRQVTTGAGNKRHPTWSPDENWIAFDSDASGTRQVYKGRSDGSGAPVQLTSGLGASDPAWEPNSNLIAYTARMGSVTRVYQIDDQGTVATALSDGGGDAGANDKQPSWQSTAATLAFASDRYTGAGDSIHNFNIWRMSDVGETTGSPAMLSAQADPSDTFSNTNPTISVPLDRQELRVVYESDKTSPSRDNIDLYSHMLADVLPPRLGEIPRVDNRLPAPGADVQISVPVSDAGSGVRQVTAILHDPDRKLYAVSTGLVFDSGFTEGNRWLEMESVIVGTVELTDPEGDGTYAGTFTTELAPHDYIIDIEASDNVGNSLRYDSLFGFSTREFTPTGRVLFVDDYCEGQKFISRLGDNSTIPVGFPVESYYRSNPGFEQTARGTISSDSIAGFFGLSYDTWRVICRGRVPATVYSIYKPTIEFQLDPEAQASDPTDAQPTRRVPVSEHMIVWAAPHTGNVWVPSNSGSLVDPAVQADLSNYMSTGGKLFVSGQDIGWALTLNGTTANTFFTNTLHANFVTDRAMGYGFTLGGQATDPVAGPIWGGGYDAEDAPVNMETPRVTNDVADGWKQDAANNSYFPDAITVLAPAVKLYGYNAEGDFAYDGPAGGLHFQDVTNGAQLVYLAFGFEQIHRGYHAPGAGAHCANHRSRLLTNSYIWMTTGSFQGRVLAMDGQPIQNPSPIVRALQGGEVKYAVRCQSDGTYVMNGVAPGNYLLEAFHPQYQLARDAGVHLAHAAKAPDVVDFVLNAAPPGAISGTVTAQATGQVLGNVKITIYQAVAATPPATGFVRGDEVGSTTTAADGTYAIGVPPGTYIAEADGTDIGYGTAEQMVDVTSSTSTRADFQLGAAPGNLEITVQRPGTLGPEPLAGATVQVLQGTTVVASGVTDGNGRVTREVPAGTYTVTASAPGFGVGSQAGQVVMPSGITQVTITLSPEADGSLSGKIVSAASGTPIGGVTVHLRVNGVDVVPAVQSDPQFTTPAVGDPYNYRFPSAPAGVVDVVPEAPGFTITPPSRTVTVVTERETTSVNFTLSSLHTFAAGLSLISMPYDYPTREVGGVDVNDPARLLGQGGGGLMLATWLPQANRYALYPQAPADHFRLGSGYWLNLPARVDLTRAGTPGGDPYPIHVKAGFNIIGDPFDQQIDFGTVQVEDENHVMMSLQQAITSSPPKLQGTLFAYVLGGYRMVSTMNPWVGYWLRAGEPLTLWVSAATGGLSVESGPATSAVRARWGMDAPAGGWLLPLTVRGAGCADEATILGVSAQGKATYNSLTDQLKPPAVDFQPYIYAALVKDGAPGPLAVDMRAAAARQSWVVSVQTNQKGAQVVVGWPDLSLLPNEVRPVLEDLATGQRVYMRTSAGYRFTAQEGERRFKITAVVSEPGTAVVSALSATPGAGRVSLCYTLGAESAVTVEIRNLSGVVVRRLVSSLPQGAGVQTLTWNGRNGAGSAAPAGRYLVTVKAQTPEGQVAQAVTGVWLGR